MKEGHTWEVFAQKHEHNQTQARTEADHVCLVWMLWTTALTDLSEREGMCAVHTPQALFRDNGQLRQPICLEPKPLKVPIKHSPSGKG